MNGQVGGDYYKDTKAGGHCIHCDAELLPWDIAEGFDLDSFQLNIIKYIMRWEYKGGVQDLDKAEHYLRRYKDLARRRLNKKYARKAPAKSINTRPDGQPPVSD